MPVSGMGHIQCSVCGADFPSRQQMQEHYAEAHGQKAAQNTTDEEGVHCPSCDLPFKTFEEVEVHNRSKHSSEARS